MNLWLYDLENYGFWRRKRDNGSILVVKRLKIFEGAWTGVGRFNLGPYTPRSVSNYHCVIGLFNGEMIVRDLDSTNGTWVNGARISEETTLTPFNILQLGIYRLRFSPKDELDPVRFHLSREQLKDYRSLKADY